MTQRISSTSNWYSPQISYCHMNMAIAQSSDNGPSSKRSCSSSKSASFILSGLVVLHQSEIMMCRLPGVISEIDMQLLSGTFPDS